MHARITLKPFAHSWGINVGGHNKVPMDDLKKVLADMGFRNIVTLLNSGNVIFEIEKTGIEQLETAISDRLKNFFGFTVPAIIRDAEDFLVIRRLEPFKKIKMTKDTRSCVTFLKQMHEASVSLPWTSDDKSLKILDMNNGIVFSVLDLSIDKTPKAMENLEKIFGRDITTRNWNTIEKIIRIILSNNVSRKKH